jgi:alpha-tubulin suppressor-like RCC1 family protein
MDVVGLPSGVVDVSAGRTHTCAVLASGGLRCWGENTDGALGDGQDVTATRPVPVAALGASVGSVSVGASQTCAVSGGAAYCWGSGDLGSDQTVNHGLSTLPLPVQGQGAGIAQISAGYGGACSRSTSGAVTCWGTNSRGRLGNGSAEPGSDIPVPVSGILSGATDLSVGDEGFVCAVVSGGARCWGSNNMGELGDGTTTDRPTPVPVAGLGSGVAAVAAGGEHACALTTSGGVQCWGNNLYGQLGNGTTAFFAKPVPVTGLSSGVIAISAGYFHTCAVKADGTVVCWGHNDQGQLGDGSTTGSTTPKPVAYLSGGVVAIAAGTRSTCATTTGGAFCWGSNLHGLLGDGTTMPSLVRAKVSGIGVGATAVAVGPTRACAVVDGALSCWGDRTDGALGDGSSTRVPTPQAVLGF